MCVCMCMCGGGFSGWKFTGKKHPGEKEGFWLNWMAEETPDQKLRMAREQRWEILVK